MKNAEECHLIEENSHVWEGKQDSLVFDQEYANKQKEETLREGINRKIF